MLKNFKFNLFIRLLLLIGLVLALVYFYQNTDHYVTIFILALILVIVVWQIVRYVDQTNRDFTSFLLGIKYEDFSATYSGHHKGKTFGELYEAFNQINQKFLNIRSEQEANHNYLQTIVENVDVGLLCFDEDDKVVLMNKRLKEILKKPYLLDVYYLKQVDDMLFETIKKLEHGDRELVKINVDNELLQLSLQAVEFKMKKNAFKLVSLQNIHGELEEQELISWQKLIRVLTHEIMNSVTPIASLATTMESMLQEDEPLTEPELADIRMALKTINRRSEALLKFTETYRNLTRVPLPTFETVDAREMLRRVEMLFRPVFADKAIDFKMVLPEKPVFIEADPGLIEQVLINLVKNAIEAVAGEQKQADPEIILRLERLSNQSPVIRVVDNGPGIDEEKIGQIFMPFFTTKKEGSGIGLSLSRQIMQMHKGSLAVLSELDEGTVFTLRF